MQIFFIFFKSLFSIICIFVNTTYQKIPNKTFNNYIFWYIFQNLYISFNTFEIFFGWMYMYGTTYGKMFIFRNIYFNLFTFHIIAFVNFIRLDTIPNIYFILYHFFVIPRLWFSKHCTMFEWHPKKFLDLRAKDIYKIIHKIFADFFICYLSLFHWSIIYNFYDFINENIYIINKFYIY